MTWHPIETAPKDGTAFLAFDANRARKRGQMIVAMFGQFGFVTCPGIYTLSATHWMPLPAPPEQQR